MKIGIFFFLICFFCTYSLVPAPGIQVVLNKYLLNEWICWIFGMPIEVYICDIIYILLEKAVAPHSSTLAMKIHGWRSLVGCSPWGRTWLSDFTFTFYFHALEKEMASHSSILAWRIAGTGKPGGLPSIGSHRVGHDWSDLAAAAYVL